MIAILPAQNKRKPWRMQAIEIPPPPGYISARIMLCEPNELEPEEQLEMKKPDGRKTPKDWTDFSRFSAIIAETPGMFTSADFEAHGFTMAIASQYLARMFTRRMIARPGKRRSTGGKPAWVYRNKVEKTAALRGVV